MTPDGTRPERNLRASPLVPRTSGRSSGIVQIGLLRTDGQNMRASRSHDMARPGFLNGIPCLS